MGEQLDAGLTYTEGGSLTAIVFDDTEQAAALLQDVQSLEEQNFIELEDAVVVVKDDKGKARITETADKSTKRGTTTGAALGLVVGLIAGGPVGGLAVGLIGGRIAGKMVDVGVDEGFIKEITNALEPGTSAALFQVKGTRNPGAVRQTLANYRGTIYSTSVDESVAEELQRLLDE